jgi:hypothetical protein
MNQAVNGGSRSHGILKDLVPVAEEQIAGDPLILAFLSADFTKALLGGRFMKIYLVKVL